jgi:hypothetical protein
MCSVLPMINKTILATLAALAIGAGTLKALDLRFETFDHGQELLVREAAIQSVLKIDGKIRINTSTGSFEITSIAMAEESKGNGTDALKIAIDDLLKAQRAREAGEIIEELDLIKRLESAHGVTKSSTDAWLALSFLHYGEGGMDTLQCLSIKQL